MSRLSRRLLAKYGADQLLAGASAKQLAKHLAAGLVDAGKSHEAEFLIDDIAAELENRHELAIAKTTSVQALTPELRSHLMSQLKRSLETKSVALDETLDQSVIGGLRVETASKVWDSTIARKLADLKEVF